MERINRAVIIVLDSVGVGQMSDSEEYGDIGVNTLGNIANHSGGISLPNLEKLGIGKIIPIKGVSDTNQHIGVVGKAQEASSGKDTTIGHWEIAGVITKEPFPTYPDGFPASIISEFEQKCGRKSIGNCVASGTEIIDRLGDQHVKTGDLIVYTSADSVFQIAAHEEIVPIDELYRYCEIARKMLKVGRIIARPFVGKSGNYERTSNRHDYSLRPPETMLDRLSANGFETIGVGKTYDIFDGKGISKTFRTKSNQEGMLKTIELMKTSFKGLVFTNLVDFDMKYGHRRDVIGYKDALERFDSQLPLLLEQLTEDDLLIITADHGCDPTYSGTDHTREYVPIVAFRKGITPSMLPVRNSFADIADTIEDLFGINNREGSFAHYLR